MQLSAIRKRFSDRRASMSVELALTSIFVLLPMLAGGADFVDLMCARSQLNATLRSLYAYAWNNPATAANTAQLAAILAIVNQHSLPQVTFPDGKADASTTYVPALSYGCVVPPSTTVSFQAMPCPTGSQQQQLMVTYSIISSVALPVPFPFGLANPFLLTATGQVEIQ